MAEHGVRLLQGDEELAAAARVVARQMLGNVSDEAVQGWAEIWRPHVAHGAFAGGELVGTAQWFRSRLATPGAPLDAAAVTAVSVLSNHRRQGHLRRLMEAELASVVDAGIPVAVLVAAEYPIYGRFGYGHATDWTELELDTRSASFLAPPTGTITLVEPAALRPALEAAYDATWARTPGAIQRDATYWDFVAGVRGLPGQRLDVGQQRGALWHDDGGALQGAVVYTVKERWTDGRPDGTGTVTLLAGATPEAERELWRHLSTVDWVTSFTADGRRGDELLPLWLVDGRAGRVRSHHDGMWLRLLDLPAAFAARRSAVPGSFVVEVDDPLGYVAGRWSVELGPDGGAASPTDAPVELRLTASTLAAAFLGGHTIRRLADAGLVDEAHDGAVARASALLATPVAPWCPLDF